MYGTPGMPGARPVPPSAGTAKTLILIALIFQIIGSVIIALIALVVGSALASIGFGGLGAIFIVIALVILLVAILAYFYSYKPVAEGHYDAARTPTLVLGIVGLFAGGVIVGILYLVAWDKLGDAIREMQPPMMTQMAYVPIAVPMGTPGIVYGAPPGTAPTAPPAAPAPPCPRCHRPGTWVPQYGRYYCYNDQLYL